MIAFVDGWQVLQSHRMAVLAVGACVVLSGILGLSLGRVLRGARTLLHSPPLPFDRRVRATRPGHAETALSRWPLTAVTVIHRHGRIAVGENIVLVLTASSHREAAFQAAEFLMDYLKTNAPFWKREENAAGGAWIEARTEDDDATARWAKP